jgi:cytochrome b subunit of formate dehydrogenase
MSMKTSDSLVTRLSFAQRAQHFALVVSFVTLALTGLPLRFPEAPGAAGLYRALGGVGVARVLHRAAAVVMIAVGAVHLVYVVSLLVKARFRPLRAWPMIPSLKDARDFWQTSLYYLGLRPHLPEYDRFNFREKFDYFAVFWGLPVMMLSGLVLWFPVFFGNHLPDTAIVAAYIAHSDEAVLAISVIVIWHMYNVHVSPGVHHRFLTWLDGKITHAEWLVSHPAEVARETGAAVDPKLRHKLLDGAWRRGKKEGA